MFDHYHKSDRQGFTLLELSLVLVILVIVAALVAPNFQGTLRQERLRKATESIAADWTQTRALAMQTGETQIWACELATGSYSASSASSTTADGASASISNVSSADLSESLPTGVLISAAMTSESDTMMTMVQTSQSSESGRATLFFFPDGTCSHARLTLNHEQNAQQSMSVMINGLAGTVRVLHGSTSPGASQ